MDNNPSGSSSLFKGRHFDSSIIILCVRWYITYKLSIKHSTNTVWRLSRKILVIELAVLLLCWPLPNSVGAAAGDLDLTFGNEGKVITDFGNSGVDRAFAIAIQRDGKMVVAGVSNQNTGSAFALARYNSDGSLDASFGTGGKVNTSFRNLGDEAHAVAIQSDGKIVTAGTAITSEVNARRDFALARYNSDGSLDTSFGTGGKVTTDFMGRLNQALIFSVQIQNDGKIVAAGRADDISSNFGLARYNDDGSLDESFGMQGKVMTPFIVFCGRARAFALALQSDGKIVAAGEASECATGFNFALARYEGDGAGFDICLQDDGSGDLLRLNSTTGDYQFVGCGDALTLGGVGGLTNRGALITLQHSASDRRVLAKVDGNANKGTASIQLFSLGRTVNIMDRNTINNTCACEVVRQEPSSKCSSYIIQLCIRQFLPFISIIECKLV